ncbi:hypothetical protein [Agromyces sp. NPDC060279]|uniref:hypothetical protein n=1 Tax=Agromyces sp. NPDC060279 TaxID=3347092 RepID=UPI00364B887A
MVRGRAAGPGPLRAAEPFDPEGAEMTDRTPPPAAGPAALGQTPAPARVAGGARALGSGSSVLPELAEAPPRTRRWWLHPAFLVSVGLTFLALAGALAWWIVSMATDSSVRVEGLTASVESGNLRLDWSGPDADYQLFVVDGDGTQSDLSGLVRGTEAWIPAAAGLADDRSCFVVRPGGTEGEVSLDAATLSGQRGASVCAADASS